MGFTLPAVPHARSDQAADIVEMLTDHHAAGIDLVNQFAGRALGSLTIGDAKNPNSRNGPAAECRADGRPTAGAGWAAI